MTWKVTAKGWIGLCPIWIAEIDSEVPVPIPRPQWLGCWMETNFFVISLFNLFLDFFYFETGYLFHHVKETNEFDIIT